jgi:hypothetical protein
MPTLQSVTCRALAIALLLGTGGADAAVNLDLSYVDRGSAAYARFRTWVDGASVSNLPYGFSCAP